MKDTFMLEAIALAKNAMNKDQGGPFGAVVVKENTIIGRGNNRVTSSNDPTAHAEIIAIREACKTMDSFWLERCEIYTSCEPCPMCLGAIYWSRIEKIYFAANKEDAARIGFDDSFFYNELNKSMPERKVKMVEFMREQALHPFNEWQFKSDKTKY